MTKKLSDMLKRLTILVVITTMILSHTTFAAELHEADRVLTDTGQTWSNAADDLASIPEFSSSKLTELFDNVFEVATEDFTAYADTFYTRSNLTTEEILEFSDMLSRGYSYSTLTYEHKDLILRNLNIARDAEGITFELLAMMEQEGFTLYESISLVRIMSTGLFDYLEAQIILKAIPYSAQRVSELHQFQQFSQNFYISEKVSARQLATGFNARQLADMSAIINANRLNVQPGFLEEYEALIYDAEEQFFDIEPEEQCGLEEQPGFEEQLHEDEEKSFEDEEQYPLDDAQYIETGKPENYQEEEYLLPIEPYIPQPQIRLVNQNPAITASLNPAGALQTRYWNSKDQKTAADWESVYPVFRAFTTEDAFNEARLMFLNGHNAAEIETAFALGAALQTDFSAFALEGRSTFEASANLYPFNIDLVRQITSAGTNEIDLIIAYGKAIMNYHASVMAVQLASIPNIPTHSDIIGSPFDLRFNANESVSLNSGAVNFRTNIISLPGRNGFGVNLDLVYNSAGSDVGIFGTYHVNLYNAHLFRTTTIQNWWGGAPIVNTQYLGTVTFDTWAERDAYIAQFERSYFNQLTQTHTDYRATRSTSPVSSPTRPKRDVFGLGPGWKFNLPYMSRGSDTISLYIPGRGRFFMSVWGNQVSAPPGSFAGDIQFGRYAFFSSGQRTSAFRITIHGGLSYFFCDDGHILGKRDRFNNTIRFQYTNVPDFLPQTGNSRNQLLLSSITDTNDNVINLQYSIQGNNRTITITGPDGLAYTINLTHIPRYIGQIGSWPATPGPVVFHHAYHRLDSIQNQSAQTTSFSYSLGETNLFLGRVHPQTHRNRTSLLRQINYPSGAQLRFEYIMADTHITNGSLRVPRVASRVLISGGREYQRTAFVYQGDATGFPREYYWRFCSCCDWPNFQVPRPLPPTHTFYTTVVQNNGLAAVYTFTNLNGRNLNTGQRTHSQSAVLSDGSVLLGPLLSDKIIGYNDNHPFPISITLTEHRDGRVRTTQETYSYNQFGQVTRATARGLTKDYIYDPRFGLPLDTTFWADNNTRIRQVNTLSADGRSIIRTHVFENNISQSRTDFIHDAFGNVIETRQFPNTLGSDFIATQTTFDRGTMPISIRISGVRDADGNLVGTGTVERRFAYDVMWRLISETDPGGYITRVRYDGAGRVTRIDFPDGGFVTYTYNDRQNTVSHRTTLGAIYVYQYDPLGNLLTISQGAAVVLTNVYDNRMRLVETRNAPGTASSRRTTFTYDVFDRAVEERHLNSSGAILHRTTTDFNDVSDQNGNRRVVTTIHGDANAPAIQTFVVYDRFGRLTQEGTTGGRIINYTNDLLGRVVRETSLGIDNVFTHNIHGITSVRNIEGSTSRSTFDHMGRLTTASDFTGNVQRFTYDALGRLIRRDTPFERANNTVHYTSSKYYYDKNSNLTRTSVSINLPGQPQAWAGTVNTFRYNRLISTQTGGTGGIRTDYTYDFAGNVLTKRVGGTGGFGGLATGGAVTSFAYNTRGRLISITDALGQRETFTQDANGLLLTKVDRNGTVFRYTHDNMGRLTREEAVINNTIIGHRQYTFTATGALRSQTVWCAASPGTTHTITYYYDRQGRLIRQEETGTTNGTANANISITHTYNTANNPTSSTVRVDGKIYIHNTYTYDIAQRLRTVSTGASGELLVTYTYNPNNTRISKTTTTPAGTIITNYSLNLAGLVTNLTNQLADGTILSSFAYIHYLDANTHQTTKQLEQTHRTITYTYDLARRLIKETQEGDLSLTTTYTFDARGNRITKTTTRQTNHTTNYTHDLNNRLLSKTITNADNTQATTTFTHDPNGNQLTQTTNDSRQTNTYNAFNQLIRFEHDNITAGYTYITAAYTHRADGLRHNKTINGETTTHIWDGSHIIMELDGSGRVTDRYIRGAGGQLIRSDRHGWYIHNVRRDIVQRVDDYGDALHTYLYDAFGNDINYAPNNGNPWRFASMYWDAHTQTYMTPNRHFNPRIGRWTQPDPFWGLHNMQNCNWSILQSGNLFVYTINNPVRFVDPSGRHVVLLHGTDIFGYYLPIERTHDSRTWTEDFRNYLRELFNNERVFAPNWSGENCAIARREQGAYIAHRILQDRADNNITTPIRIIGFSHGGNVAIEAANYLNARGYTVANLVTIGTPVRPDHQLVSGSSVGQHINVYNTRDLIQTAGGRMVLASGAPMFAGGPSFVTPTLEPAGRTFSGAENIRVPPAGGWHRIAQNHGFMHSNVDLWRVHISHAVRR